MTGVQTCALPICLPRALLRAGSRPGRTSNFHLSGQMKVTKAKALNTSDLACRIRATTSVACKGHSGVLANDIALRTANCESVPDARCQVPLPVRPMWPVRPCGSATMCPALLCVQPSRQAGPSASRLLKACTPRWLSPHEAIQMAGVGPFALVTFIWAGK